MSYLRFSLPRLLLSLLIGGLALTLSLIWLTQPAYSQPVSEPIDLHLPNLGGQRAQTVLVPLRLETTRPLSLSRAELTLSFDSTLLTLREVLPGGLKADLPWQPMALSASQVVISLGGSETFILPTSGSLLWLSFELTGTVGLSSPLTLQAMLHDAADQPLSTTVTSGQISIVGDYAGPGDLNRDKIVDAADVDEALRQILAANLATAADLDSDGLNTAADLGRLVFRTRQHSWPVPGQVFPAPTDTGPIILSLGQARAEAGRTAILNLQADNLPPWAAADLYLQYDPAFIPEVLAVHPTTPTQPSVFSFTHAGPGQVRILLANDLPLTGTGALLSLQLRLTDTVAGQQQTSLTLSATHFYDLFGQPIPSDAFQPVAGQVIIRPAQPGLELSAGYTQFGRPGDTITFAHILTNTGLQTDPVRLAARSAQGWPLQLQQSGSVNLPLSLGPGASEVIRLQVQIPERGSLVPGSLGSGSLQLSDQVTLRATSGLSPGLLRRVTNTLIVRDTLPQAGMVYLPLVYRDMLPPEPPEPPLQQVEFSVDFGPAIAPQEQIDHDYAVARTMGAEWVRILMPWNGIEVEPGVYDWTQTDLTLAAVEAAGLKSLVIIYGNPDWTAATGCGPIDDTAAFVAFLNALIDRHGRQIAAWEFINEPEAYEPHPWPFIGCWSPYPEAYAEQLGLFYQTIKNRDPDDLVLFGGLAYDNWVVFDRSFFDNALQAGAGAYFDILSVHYYPIASSFPTLAAKIGELQETMRRNGVAGKRVWVTETSMWINPPWGNLTEQKNYVLRGPARAFCSQTDNVFWFAARQEPDELRYYYDRWLIGLDHQPDNAFFTFRHMRDQLSGGHCNHTFVSPAEGIEAYHFNVDQRQVTVLWAESQPQQISWAYQGYLQLIDRDGRAARIYPPEASPVTVEVGPTPMFIVETGERE